jgi:imidazole glycerol phosphate synthase subunit HisF
MTGYNFTLLEELILHADIPVIISGGCRGHECLINAHNRGFDGAVMSSIFLWQGDSIPSLKRELMNLIPVRVVM